MRRLPSALALPWAVLLLGLSAGIAVGADGAAGASSTRIRPALSPDRAGAGIPTGADSATAAGATAGASNARIRPAFSPDRAGAGTALTLAADFTGAPQQLPSPLRGAVIHLPAGLRIDLGRLASCPLGHLRAHGPSACPSTSALGSGSAILAAELGSQTISENITLRAFRGPNRGARPTLEIAGQGFTPLVERITIVGVLEPDRPPYGAKLVLSIPSIPTVPTEPDAATVRFSLTLGSSEKTIGHAANGTGAIRVPASCPAGGFPFAADFQYADRASSHAGGRVPCP
jgi:hypothetical protein